MKVSLAADLRASGHFRLKCYKPGTNELTRELSFPNLIVNNEGNGIHQMLRVFAGLGTALELDTLKIGTGTTAADAADTDLETPVASVARSLREISGNDLLLTFFIPDDLLPEDEYTEFGVFIGEDRIFSRALASPTYTKSVSEDVIIEYTLTVTNA